MIQALVTLLIYLACVGILIWVVYYVVDNVPIPDPFGRWAKILCVVFAALIIIAFLLSLAGVGGIDMPRLGGLNEVHPYVTDTISTVYCQPSACTASM